MERFDASLHNAFYSGRYQELTRLLGQQKTMRNRKLNLQAADVEPCMQIYPYALSAWPVIISDERIAEFDDFISRLPALYLKAIKCMFGDDAAAFTRYLLEPTELHSLLMDTPLDVTQMFNRHDVLYSQGNLKLLEVNSGTTIGGWQPGLVEIQFRQVLKEFPATADWDLHHRSVMDNLFKIVYAQMQRLNPAADNLNILLLLMLSDEERHLAAEWCSLLELIFQRAIGSFPKCGKLVLFTDLERVEFPESGEVRFDGQQFDAILLPAPQYLTAHETVLKQLTRAHCARRIVMPDCELYTVFGNKMLMALLHEPALEPHLSAHELDFIARHIPFTTPMQEKTLRWGGKESLLSDLLSSCKQDFVIKKSHSMQGRDVYVGKFIEQAEWDAIIQRHLGVEDWLAQQYCQADLALAVDASGELNTHAFIWGIFDGGARYSGAFVRGMATGPGNGVINSATGAVEFSVFEEVAA